MTIKFKDAISAQACLLVSSNLDQTRFRSESLTIIVSSENERAFLWREAGMYTVYREAV